MKKILLLILFLPSVYLAYSQADAGPAKFICKGSSVTIGNNDDDPKLCFSWKASPADADADKAKTAKVKVKPAQTTTYTLTLVGQDFSSRSTSQVVVTVVENPAFDAKTADVAADAAASIPLGAGVWGFTYPENVEVKITACSDGTNWNAIVTSMKGHYSEQVRLLPGVTEVTGPDAGGNTTMANFCKQVTDLKALTLRAEKWFMLGAVQAHEDVHATRFKPAIQTVAGEIEKLVEKITVADKGQSQADAIKEIEASDDFKKALAQAQRLWLADILVKVKDDHNGGAGPTYVAERGVLNPMIMKICDFANKKKWPACAACP
jgi:hypothetical protein